MIIANVELAKYESRCEMKICIECGRELFDFDELCDVCNSKNLISEKEYNDIVTEIQCSNIFTRKKLLKNHNYECIYNRLQQPKVTYPKPEILNNTSCESDNDYWERINQHTINKKFLTNVTIECPFCHSTNTKKITTVSKVVNTAIFGIFGTKRYNQWHCNHCNSDF